MLKVKQMLNTKLFKNGFWLFLLQIFNTVVPLVTLPYITRVLGTANYGIFALALNWITYLQVIVEFGFGYTGARKVSSMRAEDVQALYSRIISARLILLAVSYAALNFFSIITKASKEHYISMNILFLVIIGVAFQLTWLFQGKQDMRFITVINAVSRLASVALVFLIVKDQSNLYLYCFAYSVTFILSGAIGIVLANNRYGLKVRLCRVRDAMLEMKDGWYLFVSQAMQKIIGAVGTTVLGLVATSSEIGIYTAIYKLPQIMILFFNPISQTLYPYVSVKFADSFKKGWDTVKKTAKYVVPFFSLCGIIICVFRVLIITILFGGEYQKFDLILIPLMAWMVLSIINNFLGVQVLVASGNQKKYSRAVTAGAIVTVVLNICMGCLYGIYGISLAAAAGELFLTVILAIEVAGIKKRKECR